MGPTELEKTIENANKALLSFAHMHCIKVWRSVGSNIFFEYGMPSIKRVKPKNRPAFTVVRGDVAIGIHADSWCLRIGSRQIMTSITLSDHYVTHMDEELFRGLPIPRFGFSDDGLLQLQFERSITITVGQNDYVDESDIDDELTINLSSWDFRFNYRRGFYSSEA